MVLNYEEINNCDGFLYYFNGKCYTLKKDNIIIGLAKCIEDGTSIYISQIEIITQYQGLGYGKIFFNLLKEYFFNAEEFYGIATEDSYEFWEAMGCSWSYSDGFDISLDENEFSIKL